MRRTAPTGRTVSKTGQGNTLVDRLMDMVAHDPYRGLDEPGRDDVPDEPERPKRRKRRPR